jgi:hypothetical protein
MYSNIGIRSTCPRDHNWHGDCWHSATCTDASADAYAYAAAYPYADVNTNANADPDSSAGTVIDPHANACAGTDDYARAIQRIPSACIIFAVGIPAEYRCVEVYRW